MEKLLQQIDTLQARINVQAEAILEDTPLAPPKRKGHRRLPWDSQVMDLATILAVQDYSLRSLPGYWLEPEIRTIQDPVGMMEQDALPSTMRTLDEIKRMYTALPERIQCRSSHVEVNSCIDVLVASTVAQYGPFTSADILNGMQHRGMMADDLAGLLFGCSVLELLQPDLPGLPNVKRKRALTMIKDRIKVFLKEGLIRDYGQKLHAEVINPFQLKDKRCTSWIIERSTNPGELPF
jgi:hypothetical protein